MSVVTPFKGEEPTSMRLATPMAMLDRAIEQGAGIEVMTKLMELAKRAQKGAARKAFDAAIADAKNEMPIRSSSTSRRPGRTTTNMRTSPKMRERSIRSSSKSGSRIASGRTQNGPIVVTCILIHRDGHFEENSLPADTDTSGNKNPNPGDRLKAVTYLIRYTLKAALGLAASNDDDGNAAGDPLNQS